MVDVDSVINALEDGTQQVTATITDDESNGTSGNDVLNGDDEDNTLNGEDGTDRLYGKGGNDNIDGGAGNDFIRSGDDNDTVTGGNGRDIIYGDENNDILVGGLDRDILVGGNGNDTLSGGTFNPVTNSSSGTDNVRDLLRGDRGSDVFIIHADHTGDIIYDFENDIDKLGLSGGLSSSDLDISDNGSFTTIALSGGNTLATLLGVSDSTQIMDDLITL